MKRVKKKKNNFEKKFLTKKVKKKLHKMYLEFEEGFQRNK